MKYTMTHFKTQATELLNQMTLEEKIGQLSLFGSLKSAKLEYLKAGHVGGLLNVCGATQVNELQRIATQETRLGIPLLIGDDVIHGFRTTFPIPLASASSWDLEKIELAESVAAREAYVSGVNWIYAPMVDICRDPRWGRIAEGAGEDPFLGSRVAKARIKGLQTINPETGYPYTAACPKHFAAYGLAEGGRDYDGADISEHTLHSTYMPPYKAAIDAGAMSIMSSFNTINGQPGSGSKKFLSDILRGDYGFEGFVVSDWESIMELIYHRIAADRKDAARLGILSGCDMDMHSGVYIEHLESLVKEDTSIEEAINESVLRILCVKFALGLFENPYRSFEDESQTILCDEFRTITRDVAKRSIVLLKNENSLLPLKEEKKKILVTGPLANSHEDMLGMWRCKGSPWDVVTVYQALQNRSDTITSYIKGCEIEKKCTCEFEEAKALAADSDVIIYVCGEPEGWTGEIHCRSDIRLPQIQEDYLDALKSTGKPVVAVLMTGRPLACVHLAKKADAILLAWHLGIEAGPAVCDVVFGDYAPAAKLPVTFPRATGQIPIYYSRLSSGRPYEYFTRYLDVDVSPLYPFGYGLTYSPITYSNLSLEKSTLKDGENLILHVDVSNEGTIDTEEVLQVYFMDMVSTMATPERRLCDFQKVMIPASQTKTVSFSIPSHQFTFLSADLTPVLEPGEFKLFVGTDSTASLSINFQCVQ